MKLQAIGGPAHEQEFDIPDDMPRNVPWVVLERTKDPFGLIDVPLTALSLDLSEPRRHYYYRRKLAGTSRDYLHHDPKRCGCRI